MRIGIDFRGVLTGQLSGIEQYTLQLFEHLLKIDTENTYVLFYVEHKDQTQVLKQLTLDHPWLAAKNIEVRKLRWVNFPLLLHAFFKPLNWPKADIICGGLDVMFMPSPRLLPLSPKCKKVTTFHDLIFLLFPKFYTLSSRLWQWQMSYPYEARTSDAVIAVSNTTKQDILRFTHARPEKIAVIYEGVGEEYFVPVADEVWNQFKNKHNIPEKYIYYVGSIEPRKNLRLIIEALKILRDQRSDTIKLVISGSKSWLSSDLYKRVQELGLSEAVVFTGRVSEEEKIACMQNAFVFAFPSFYEGFGLMVLEAFACRCPVIVSDQGALPEIAGDAALIVDPMRPHALADAISRLNTNPTLKVHLIEKGYLRAKKFTWENTAKATLEIFQKVVKG